MAGKKAAGGAAKRGGAAEPPSSGERQSSGRKRKNQGWPWWLWGFGGVALIACAGRLLAGPGEPPSTGKKGGGGGAKGKAGAAAEKGSTASYLDLAMRLAEATQAATTLQSAGQLDGEAARALDEELTAMEVEIEGLDSTVARDLRAMVSVVRGTLYKHTEGVSDAEVESKTRSSFTYDDPRYWDDYYNKTSKEERYDWYGSWDTPVLVKPAAASGAEPAEEGEGEEAARESRRLGDLLRPHLERESRRILMLGCGNSDMSAKMYREGFEEIVNIDISQTLVDRLRAEHAAAMPKMEWLFMNASDLAFDDASFDVVLDKGTLDAIEQDEPLLGAAVKEAHRALRPGGVFLSVTFGTPAVRVERQLRGAAAWGSCSSRPFEKDSAARADRSRFWVHACERP